MPPPPQRRVTHVIRVSTRGGFGFANARKNNAPAERRRRNLVYWQTSQRPDTTKSILYQLVRLYRRRPTSIGSRNEDRKDEARVTSDQG